MEQEAKLYDVDNDLGGTAYCGPRAIAHLTGLPISAVEDLFRRRRRGQRHSNKRVASTFVAEQLLVLKSLGCRVTKLSKPAPTIGRLLDDTKHVALPILVEVSGHVCVVHKGVCTDSIVRPARRVMRAWTVARPAIINYKPLAVRPSKPAPTKLDQAKAKLAAVQQRRAAWISKRKRAETAIRKLNESVKYYEGRVAQLGSPASV